MAPALDLANTVAVSEGAEHDLVGDRDDFDEWARVESRFLPEGDADLLQRHRRELMEARAAVRDLLTAVSAGGRGPRAAVATLNALSRGAPEWQELDESSWRVETRSDTGAGKRLLARYARSAMELVATEAETLRRCPAPSCGMFYVSTRGSQRWCSTQCGTRARVARHYRARRETT